MPSPSNDSSFCEDYCFLKEKKARNYVLKLILSLVETKSSDSFMLGIKRETQYLWLESFLLYKRDIKFQLQIKFSVQSLH